MSTGFITGTRKGLFIHEKFKGGWRVAHRAFAGVKVPMVLPDGRDGSLYAAVDHGHFGTKLHRSRDGGATWEELPPLVYPPKPDDVPEIKDQFRDKVVPRSLEMIWSLEAGGADEPGVLWCGTSPGAFSSRRTTVPSGRWCVRCGTCRSGRTGLAAVMTSREFTPSAWIRGTRSDSPLPSPAGAYDARRTAVPRGRC